MTKVSKATSTTAPVALERGQQFIRAWRKASGMSVNELGAKAGISGSMVAQLERGATGYTQRSLEHIAHALGVPAWQLLCGGPDEVPQAGDLVGDAARMWDDVPEELRPLARDIIAGNAANIRGLIKLIIMAAVREREAA